MFAIQTKEDGILLRPKSKIKGLDILDIVRKAMYHVFFSTQKSDGKWTNEQKNFA